MSEWRLVWRVTLRYRNPADNAGYPTREVVVESARQLRRVVEWARANPRIAGFPHERVRKLVGEAPGACQLGHPYTGLVASRRRVEWLDCTCGGHVAYHCGVPECSDVQSDPLIHVDCSARSGGQAGNRQA